MTKKKSAKSRGGPGRLSAEDAARLPDRLLDAALELFNERTYAEATMEQIARGGGRRGGQPDRGADMGGTRRGCCIRSAPGRAAGLHNRLGKGDRGGNRR